MAESLKEMISNRSIDSFLSFENQKIIAQQLSIPYIKIEREALSMRITPLRYKQNQTTITPKDQLKLLNSCIAIIGAGGLGGHIAEMLARIGVGKLTIFDHDIFEEHNLNRQNFSTIDAIGKEKAIIVKKGLERINPSIEVEAIVKKFRPIKDFTLVSDADVVVDALDDPKIKLDLAKICKQNEKSFVHGAIAGMNGQFSTNSTLEHLYQDGALGAEISAGNPSFSTTFAASIQTAEIVKILLGIGDTLDGELLMTDLLYNEFHILPA
jgi:molybdopterin/thiamine biosynthesis adenylyltransferase